ncbi:Uncharacterised protein [Legionella wadsworthii]|uniref:Uncharacterized protein n=1 Tax=Legionella wadsworthii TaxID=28088 RepID=A0A378LRF6_9GAMM|nr:hypothetical protein [Legionella wadsworthii]STY29496.1 Uncharacterised protein [Legionella wadsworthii]
MFTPIEKNLKQKYVHLIQNAIELHSRVNECRDLVLASLKNDKFEPIEIKKMQEINWNLFLLEMEVGSQRDQLKYSSYLNIKSLNAHFDRYEEYSATFRSVVQEMQATNSLSKFQNDKDNWFDWDYSEDITSSESFSLK